MKLNISIKHQASLNLFLKIKNKSISIWRYLYCCCHGDSFIPRKVLFNFLFINQKPNRSYSSILPDPNNLLNQNSYVDRDYQKRILTYHYDSSIIQSACDKVEFYQGSPLAESQTFFNVIYMPRYRAFYLRDGSLIDYSCRPEYTIAPKNITVPKYLTQVDIPLIYGGHLNRHYGHFLTESICRLWYLGKDTSRQVIYSESYRSSIEKNFIDVFMNSIFDKKRFISFSRPILLKEVTIPHASFVFNKKAFSVHKLLPESVAEKLLPIKITRVEQPLYFSRKKLNSKNSFRNIRDEKILEEKLREKNFAIAYPEELTLQEQIVLVNRHKVLLGICGSALHNILFDLSSSLNLVCLADEDRINSNFLLVDGIKNVNSCYIAALKLQQDSSKKINRLRQTRKVNLENAISGLKELGLF